MDEREAYRFLAGKLGISEKTVQYLAEVTMDLSLINPILPETVKRLGPLMDLKPGKEILDLACGKGGMSLPLVFTYKVKLIGVDAMPDFIREAWSRAEYSGIYEMCRFILGDASVFAANAGRDWDAVLVNGALTIVWDSFEEGLEAVRPLVRPGGFLVLGHPYQEPGSEPEPSATYWTKEETTERLKAFGEVVEVFDDGDAGWEAYIAPQVNAVANLIERNPGQEEMAAFLDEWMKRLDWDRKNMGFALWVIKKA